MRYMVGIIKLWLPQIHLSLLTGNFGLGSGMNEEQYNKKRGNMITDNSI